MKSKYSTFVCICFIFKMEMKMAFKTAAGYGNLPNGNFSPVIYSKQVQLAFRKDIRC